MVQCKQCGKKAASRSSIKAQVDFLVPMGNLDDLQISAAGVWTGKKREGQSGEAKSFWKRRVVVLDGGASCRQK